MPQMWSAITHQTKTSFLVYCYTTCPPVQHNDRQMQFSRNVSKCLW